jgi:hypothetical protein
MIPARDATLIAETLELLGRVLTHPHDHDSSYLRGLAVATRTARALLPARLSRHEHESPLT